MVVAFNIISIKLWGVAMARDVGGKREPRKREEKKNTGKEREREASRYSEKWLCLHEIRPRS